MDTSEEYTRIGLLHQGRYGPLYTALRASDERAVVLKVYEAARSRSPPALRPS